jgi:hypothetical protein
MSVDYPGPHDHNACRSQTLVVRSPTERNRRLCSLVAMNGRRSLVGRGSVSRTIIAQYLIRIRKGDSAAMNPADKACTG